MQTPPPHQRRKPTGKIAELPKKQRDRINQLLDDGASYRSICSQMAAHNLKLNAENISNWFTGGYQDHRQNKLWIQEISSVTDRACDLVSDPYQSVKLLSSANHLAVVQIFQMLKAGQFAADDPKEYTRLLNTLARLSREAVLLAKYLGDHEPYDEDEEDDDPFNPFSATLDLLRSRLSPRANPTPVPSPASSTLAQPAAKKAAFPAIVPALPASASNGPTTLADGHDPTPASTPASSTASSSPFLVPPSDRQINPPPPDDARRGSARPRMWPDRPGSLHPLPPSATEPAPSGNDDAL